MADVPVSFPGYSEVEVWRQGSVTCSYRAVQQSIGRRVFIKALNTNVLPSSPFAAALEREAHVLALLRHRSFPQIHDFVRTEEQMWIVLEGIEGWTLEEVLERTRSLAPEVAAAILLQISAALEHLHDHQVIHSDLQPHNVFLTPGGEICLFGFSSAHLPDEAEVPELLEGDDGVVAPFYKSPEQILGEKLSPSTDLYSAGVVLYEMLAGQRPFEAPEARTVSQKIRNEAAPALQEIATGTPGALQRIAQRCMEKLAADRFYSARELRNALDAYLVAHTTVSPRALTREGLLAAGLAGGAVPEHRATVPPMAPAVFRRSGLGTTFGVYGACLLLAIAGGAAIQIWFPTPVRRAAHEQTLELVPPSAAHVRVVAEPWAHVIIDGQRIDTTPFARPIPLRPGTHYVQLEHPNAPTVQRTLHLGAGETALLDVKMDVPAAAAPSANPGSSKPRLDAGPPSP